MTSKIHDGRRVALLVAVPAVAAVLLLVPTVILIVLWEPGFLLSGLIVGAAVALPAWAGVLLRRRAARPGIATSSTVHGAGMVRDVAKPFAAGTPDEPDPRPLGALALGLAVLAALAAPTYFLSAFAYLAAAPAIALGVVARGMERSRSLGTGAAVLAAVAVVVATAFLVWF